MSKVIPAIFLIALGTGAFCLRQLQVNPVRNAHAFNAYDEWLAGEFQKLRGGHERGEEDRMDEPEKFAEFDRILRADPRTGQVPEMGLIRAWNTVRGMASAQRGGQTNRSLQWRERGPSGVGGRTRALLFDRMDATGKTLFAGGVGGGLWKTTDITAATPNWVNVDPMFSNVAVTTIAQDPGNPFVMYFGTGEGWNNADAIRGAGIWKSTDGGNSWNVLPSTQNPSFFYNQKIAVNSLGHVFAGTKNGMFKSTDGGSTFTRTLGSGLPDGSDFITDIELSANGHLYVACHSNGIYKSPPGTTQGEAGTWNDLNIGFTSGYERIELACAPSDANRIYAATSVNSGAFDQVYVSTNAGMSWAVTTARPGGTNDMSNGQCWYDLTLAVSETDANIAYIGTIDVYKTTNGGGAWTRVTQAYGGNQPYMHPDQHGIAFRKGSNSGIVFSNDGGVWYTSNGGPNVAHRNNGYIVTQYYSLAIDMTGGVDLMIGGAQDNGSTAVNTPNVSAAQNLTGADGGYCAIDPNRSDTMYTTSQWETVYRSRNRGTTFASITNPNLDETNTMFINPLEIDPNNGNILYQASKALYRHTSASSGSGNGWVQCTRQLSSSGISAIGISKSTANLVYAAAGGIVYRIPNANTGTATTNPTSVDPAGLPGGYIKCIAVDPADGNHIILTYTSYGLLHHVVDIRNANLGSGATWKSLQGNLPDLPVNWAVFEPNNPNGILIATDLGVFRCSDIRLASPDIFWSPECTGLGFPRVEMIKVRPNDNLVFASTHGRGFFSTNSYTLSPVCSFGPLQANACGGYVQFVDSTRNAPVSWRWDFGDGTSSTLQNPRHFYANSGNYVVKLVSTNPNGTDSLTRNVAVNMLPLPIALAGPDTNACNGDTIQLSASGGGTYLWAPGGSLDDPASADPMAVIQGTIQYLLTVTDSNGCTDTDTMTVNMSSPPNTWAGQDQTLVNRGDTVQLRGYGGTRFLWTPSAGLDCDTCQNPKAAPDTTTTYRLTSWNAAGCSSSDNMTVFTSWVGMQPGPKGNSLLLFSPSPDPSDGVFRIRFALPVSQPVRFQLTDIKGSILREWAAETYPAGQSEMTVDVRGLSPGIYFVRMEAGGEFRVKKVMLH